MTHLSAIHIQQEKEILQKTFLLSRQEAHRLINAFKKQHHLTIEIVQAQIAYLSISIAQSSTKHLLTKALLLAPNKKLHQLALKAMPLSIHLNAVSGKKDAITRWGEGYHKLEEETLSDLSTREGRNKVTKILPQWNSENSTLRILIEKKILETDFKLITETRQAKLENHHTTLKVASKLDFEVLSLAFLHLIDEFQLANIEYDSIVEELTETTLEALSRNQKLTLLLCSNENWNKNKFLFGYEEGTRISKILHFSGVWSHLKVNKWESSFQEVREICDLAQNEELQPTVGFSYAIYKFFEELIYNRSNAKSSCSRHVTILHHLDHLMKSILSWEESNKFDHFPNKYEVLQQLGLIFQERYATNDK
jgi:hypothetical protein